MIDKFVITTVCTYTVVQYLSKLYKSHAQNFIYLNYSNFQISLEPITHNYVVLPTIDQLQYGLVWYSSDSFPNQTSVCADFNLLLQQTMQVK